MKTPFTCHILIPEDLRENPLFQIPEGIKQELTCEYYQTVSPKNDGMRPCHPIGCSS